uniref:Uncharacterized protein n=1 Tax=Oryza glumipatula TaxID=40148 RepID=A0A0E0BPR8_9ORYZ
MSRRRGEGGGFLRDCGCGHAVAGSPPSAVEASPARRQCAAAIFVLRRLLAWAALPPSSTISRRRRGLEFVSGGYLHFPGLVALSIEETSGDCKTTLY